MENNVTLLHHRYWCGQQSVTLATSLKPESSRNYFGLVKAHASLARQSEPPPTPSPLPSMHCTFATWQLNHRLEKRRGGASKRFHLLTLQSSTEKSIWHRLGQIYLPMTNSVSLVETQAEGLIMRMISICSRRPISLEMIFVRSSMIDTCCAFVIKLLFKTKVKTFKTFYNSCILHAIT